MGLLFQQAVTSFRFSTQLLASFLGQWFQWQFDAWPAESACCLVLVGLPWSLLGPSGARESSPGQATRCLKGKSPQPQGLECLLAQRVGPPRPLPPGPGRPVSLGVCRVCPLATSGQSPADALVLAGGRTPACHGGGASLPGSPPVQGCGSGDARPGPCAAGWGL